ncbi:SMI1/KNR4 family protein [Streptomyces sp. SM11]|uniref:SMI1/KNR4 family protein n=1 Tax=Streptomyces sp. SM11 TaxID=565557 RepID=UPI0015E164E3|nr:SMI1/KNR4 family protein [Streptomyces sp. SM11]
MDSPVGSAAVQALSPLLRSDYAVGEQVDWSNLTRSWGTGFPSDYVAFMSAYGAGGISDAFEVLRPDEFSAGDSDGMAGETANARAVWPSEYRPVEGFSSLKSPVIAWGVTAGADVVCWLTRDESPDRWPVVVVGRDGFSRWASHECGMAEFLRRVFSGELEACPFSDATLWGTGAQRFVHGKEERRLLESGVDPWTGGPDPLAGIGFD